MSFISLFKNKKRMVLLCAFLFMTSAIIILALNLGINSGTFVIKVQESSSDRQIRLSLDPKDPASKTSRLETKGISNFTDNNPIYYLEKDENGEYTNLKSITTVVGENHITNEVQKVTSLFCYTFYIMNTGVGTVDITPEMTFMNVTNYNDTIARIMTVRESSTGAIDTLDIYYKKDDDDSYVDYTQKGYPKAPVEFADDKTIFNGSRRSERFQIRENEYIKYSVLYWMEGEDPDSEKYGELLFGGTIRFELKFVVELSA